MVTESRIENRLSKWTMLSHVQDGVRFETAVGRLTATDRQQLRHVLDVLDAESLNCSKCGRDIKANEPHQPGLGTGVLCVRCVRETPDEAEIKRFAWESRDNY